MATTQLQLNFMGDRKGYSDEDLAFFKKLIEDKLASAREILQEQKEIMNGSGGNQTSDTSWSFKPDDNPEYSNKQEAALIARKQELLIESLNGSLIRIDKKTYGICATTGELIDRQRLIAVPGTRTSIAVKNQQQQPVLLPPMIGDEE